MRYMADDNRTVTLNLRVRPSVKAMLERSAKAERRSMTNLVEKLIEDHAAAQKARK